MIFWNNEQYGEKQSREWEYDVGQERCPGESSWRRWHLNKDMKEIVGTPGEDHSSRGRASQSKEYERKVAAQSAQHERGAVGERESR